MNFNSKKAQCMCIGKDGELFQCDIYLERIVKLVNCARHFGKLITRDLKDYDDIRLKRGHFQRSVSNLRAKFKGTLNNPDFAPNFSTHIVVLFVVPSSETFVANHLMIFVLHGRTLLGGFSIYHIAHIYIQCHMALGVNIYKLIWSIDLRINLIHWCQAIMQLLAFNAVLYNTLIGLDRHFFSERNSVRTDENERGCLYSLYYTFALNIGIFPSFKEMILICRITLYVSNNLFSSVISGVRLWKVDLWLHHFVVPLTCKCIHILCTSAL